MPEGEEKRQAIENLLEKIMKENFPNLEKKIDFQKVQEAQQVPKKLDPRKHTPRHIIIITFLKVKDKKRLARRIQSDGKQGPTIIQQSYHLEWKSR